MQCAQSWCRPPAEPPSGSTSRKCKAYRNPLRKLSYDLTITSVSVLVALLVGGIETLGLIADQLHLQGVFWSAITDLNDHFGALGYGIVALFVASWGLSFLIYRFKRYELYGRLE